MNVQNIGGKDKLINLWKYLFYIRMRKNMASDITIVNNVKPLSICINNENCQNLGNMSLKIMDI